MPPVHILQISYDDSVFDPAAPSDTRARQADYARRLAAQRPGSTMTLVVVTRRAGLRPLTADGVTWRPVTGWGPVRWLWVLRVLWRLARTAQPCVIAAQTLFGDAWVALICKWLTGARVIGQVHFDLFSPIAQRDQLGGGWRGRLRLRLALAALRHLDAVRVVGRRLQQQLQAHPGCPPVQVIPVPVTLAAPPAAAPAGERVLFVGRLAPEKNLTAWLAVAQAVAAQTPTAEFEWAGDGALAGELLAEAEARGLRSRLHWAGAVAYDQLPAVYARAAVFLLTSHYEGFGRVLVEAARYGLPAVAPRMAGVEDIIVDGETGYLHAPGDLTGMAASVARLLRNPAERARLGAAALQRAAAHFAPDHLADQWVALWIATAEGAHD